MRLALATFALVIVRCASAPPPPPVEVTLERSACYGTCPVYTVHVATDGTITWEGRQFVQETGTRTATVDASRLEALARAVAKARVEELLDSYDSNCPLYATDNPTTTTTFVSGAATKRIVHYHGCLGLIELDRLTTLEDEIDEILGTKRWIE